ncbi:MAG: CBS domain-containing protein [Alphaproteobacteria bacterium]
MQIKDVMTQQCEWISPNATLAEAAQVMKKFDTGFLPVGENDKLIGAITDRDIVMRAVADNAQSASVKDVMTPQIKYCFDDQAVDDICQNMSEIKVRRLPVVNRDKRLVGVVSLGDLSQQQAPQTGEALQGITQGLQQAKAANAA